MKNRTTPIDDANGKKEVSNKDLKGDRRSTRTKNTKIVYIFMSTIVIHFINVHLLSNSKKHPSSVVPAASYEHERGYNLAKEQSFGFFDDINDANWKHYQTILAGVEDHEDPNDPHPYDDDTWQHYFLWYQSSYEPNFSCAHEQRVGGNGNGDGPKWVCDPRRIPRVSKERKVRNPSHPGCVVYSIGSDGDFSFELGMQQKVGVGTCEYHIFDMGDYEKEMPKELKNGHYHKWGIKAQEENAGDGPPKPGQRKYGLKDTIKMLGHDKLDSIDVFKIDCEGCEWKSFDSWLDPALPDLMQILVELHKPPKEIATKFFDTLQAAGYVRFHKEVNTIAPHAGAVEYSFLKLAKDFFPKSKLSVRDYFPEETEVDDKDRS